MRSEKLDEEVRNKILKNYRTIMKLNKINKTLQRKEEKQEFYNWLDKFTTKNNQLLQKLAKTPQLNYL